jgi:hypothetical protein
VQLCSSDSDGCVRQQSARPVHGWNCSLCAQNSTQYRSFYQNFQPGDNAVYNCLLFEFLSGHGRLSAIIYVVM